MGATPYKDNLFATSLGNHSWCHLSREIAKSPNISCSFIKELHLYCNTVLRFGRFFIASVCMFDTKYGTLRHRAEGLAESKIVESYKGR